MHVDKQLLLMYNLKSNSYYFLLYLKKYINHTYDIMINKIIIKDIHNNFNLFRTYI